MTEWRQVDALDLQMLERTLQLAERGRAGARPNPVVGAVLARADGAVLAEGHHHRHGEAHAERAALARVSAPVPDDASLYVSLEPCSHHGRQPPCVDAILDWGVRRVVIACTDPNPETAGIGPRRLADAGVEVVWGPREIADRAAQQNAGFQTRFRKGRPYVTYKWAMSRNGRVSTGDPSQPWISGSASRELVHYLRAGSGAVAVGIGTVLADDPLLTVRGAIATRVVAQPVRVVYDRQLRLPIGSRLVATADEAPVLACCGPDASESAEHALRSRGVDVWRAPHVDDLLQQSLAILAARGVGDLLVEAGPTLATAMFAADMFDALVCFQNELLETPADQPGFDAGHPLLAAVADVRGVRCGTDTVRTRVLHPVQAIHLP